MTFEFEVNHDLLTTTAAFRSEVQRLANSDDQVRIERGLTLATRAHLGQSRGDGSPYIVHPIRTALLAIRYFRQCTPDIIISCLLHDTLEDTTLNEADVEGEFGKTVARYVRAVTRYRPDQETAHQRAEGKRLKWEIIMGSSLEIRLIKTCDYCDNVISWQFIRPDMSAFRKIPRWLSEAKELYLPLAKITNMDIALVIEAQIDSYLYLGHAMGSSCDE